MFKIHLVLIAYAMTDTLVGVLDSLSGPDVTWHIALHSMKPEVVDICDTFAAQHPDQVRYHRYGVNRGVALSYNDGFIEAYQEGADLACLVCDDMFIPRSGLDALVAGYQAHPEAGQIIVRGLDVRTRQHVPMGFAFCAIARHMFEKVGYWDEGYWPCYYEDLDFGRRMQLAGLDFYDVGEIGLIHLGSASIRSSEEEAAKHAATFSLNTLRFIKKWGGEPTCETFTVPFNDPRFTYHIAEADRHCPYPGQEMVRP